MTELTEAARRFVESVVTDADKFSDLENKILDLGINAGVVTALEKFVPPVVIHKKSKLTGLPLCDAAMPAETAATLDMLTCVGCLRTMTRNLRRKVALYEAGVDSNG